MTARCHTLHLSTFLGVSWLFVGCAHLQSSRDLKQAVTLPHAFSNEEHPEPPSDRWWTSFDSSELNRLIEEALVAGFTVQSTWARLQQAEALAVKSRAARWPSLDGEGSGTRTEQKSNADVVPSSVTGGSGGAGRSTQSESYALALASSYELDLWGRVRAGHRAARLEAEAVRADVNTSAITVSATVAETWLRWVAQQRQLQVLHQQLATNREILDLLQLRFRNAMSNAIDVYQQEQVLAETEAALPLAEALHATLEHQLAVLLGRPPRSDLALVARELPVPPPPPDTGIPADLLWKRPDVRAAGLRLQAADADTAAARADRLPALRLTARTGYSNADFDTLFDNWFLNLAGNLTAPLFDAGRRRAEVQRTLAAADERLVQYRQTVYQAIREVEDALVNEEKQGEHIRALQRQTEAARHGLEEATSRYRNGLSDYLPVLTQLLSVQRLERTLIAQQLDQLLFRVALHRALGGSWLESERMQNIAEASE